MATQLIALLMPSISMAGYYSLIYLLSYFLTFLLSYLLTYLLTYLLSYLPVASMYFVSWSQSENTNNIIAAVCAGMIVAAVNLEITPLLMQIQLTPYYKSIAILLGFTIAIVIMNYNISDYIKAFIPSCFCNNHQDKLQNDHNNR